MARAEAEYDTQRALEFAVVAQRVNNAYLKPSEGHAVVSADNKVVDWVHTNKALICYAMGINTWQSHVPLPNMTVTEEDKRFVTELRSFYKRLAFSVMADTKNTFQQDVLVILNAPTVTAKKLGIVACLPSTYLRDKIKNEVRRTIKHCEDKVLALVGESITDKDCEIVEMKYSDTYSCWNILAIIEDCAVSWMSKERPIFGPCVLLRAKVKAHSIHWLHKVTETRLNYVKVFQ